MYKDFRHYCQTYNPKPGTLWSWKGPGSPIIINLFTQEPPDSYQSKPGKATVVYLNHALHALKQEVQNQQVTSLALPRLATGVGGLRWDETKPLIEATMKNIGIPVYVYASYKKGVEAEEPA